MSERKRMKFDHKIEAMPIFHGSTCEIHTEDFDFDRATPYSDFGKAVYFSLNYNQALKWTKRKGKGVVNWYIFRSNDAFLDPDVYVTILEDKLEWLNTILSFIDGNYNNCPDIIIGDIIDNEKATIIRYYMKIAKSRRIKMTDLDIRTKLKMLDELKPNVYGQQIAFKNQKSLKHVQFIGSIEVTKMTEIRREEPSEVAARASIIMSDEEGIPLNEALARFMKSNTFLDLLSNPDYLDMDPHKVLALYRSEVSKNVRELH